MKATKWIVIIVMVGFLFYWFEIRPANIRATCYNKTKLTSENRYESFTITEGNTYYDNCLHSFGLKN